MVRTYKTGWSLEGGAYVIVGCPDPVFREGVTVKRDLERNLVDGYYPAGTEIVHVITGKRYIVEMAKGGKRTKPRPVRVFDNERSEDRRQVYRRARWPRGRRMPSELLRDQKLIE